MRVVGAVAAALVAAVARGSAAGAPSGGEAKEQSAGQLRSKADEALISGKPDVALALLGKVIEMEPLSEKNLFKRSRIYLRLKKHANALLDLDGALRLAPQYEVALASRAKLLASLGRCAQAGADWRLALELAKKDKAAQEARAGLERAEACAAEVERGLVAKKRGNSRAYVESVGLVLEQWADALPGSLFLERARAFMALGDLYEAVADAGRALKAEPDNLEALELRGRAYYALADHAMARTHWQEALKRDPEHAACKAGYRTVRALTKAEGRGDGAAAEGKHREAIDLWRAAVAVDPGHSAFAAATHLKIARAWTTLAIFAEAASACDEALKHAPTSVDAHLLKSEALMGAEQFDAAVGAAKRAREMQDDDRTRAAQHKAEVALKQSKEVNYYKVLAVVRTATQKDIKKAYRDAALKYHPDKLDSAATDFDKEAAVERFQAIAQAYEILSDQETRAKYDRGEDVTQNHQQQQHHQHGFHGFQGGFPGNGRFQFHHGR